MQNSEKKTQKVEKQKNMYISKSYPEQLFKFAEFSINSS